MWPFAQKSKHISFLQEVRAKVLQGSMDAAYEDLISMRRKGFMTVAQGFAEYDKKYQALIAKVGSAKVNSLDVAGDIDRLEKQFEALMELYRRWV
ncbi:hypothetical protein C4580_04185 [Candidatus Woesearchaeota archaeon]|nr:MAG: hypothetical protein C4580_04185 [Candidatus Woesearchaeota archaeon]